MYTNIVSNCRHLLQQLHDVDVTHTYREQNFVADILAKGGSKMECSAEPTVFDAPPLFVINHLHADLLGTTFSRDITQGALVVGNNTPTSPRTTMKSQLQPEARLSPIRDLSFCMETRQGPTPNVLNTETYSSN